MAGKTKPSALTSVSLDAKAPGAASRSPAAPGLSRDRIVASTVAYLRANPTEPLSLRRAAAEVGVTPMALYRYFSSAADLAEAVVADVLAGLGEGPAADQADWRGEVRAWMSDLLHRLHRTPQCTSLLLTEKGLSPAWLGGAVSLQNSLSKAGLRGARLAEGVYFVIQCATGFAAQSARSDMRSQVRGVMLGFGALPRDVQKDLAGHIEEIPRIFENAFAITVDWVIASIEGMNMRRHD